MTAYLCSYFVPGLTYYADILGYMFWLVESEKITVSLSPEHPQQANMDFIYVFVGTLLKQNYTHLTE